VDCGPGMFCHAATAVCTPTTAIVRGAQGDACDLSASPPRGCATDLKCGTQGTTAGTCQPIACAAAMCDSSSFCSPYGMPIVCLPRGTEGQPCSLSLNSANPLCLPQDQCLPA